jgi:hypothetical protein
MKSRNFSPKKNYNIGPMGRYHKTFYASNLRECPSYTSVFVSVKLSEPSKMFAVKARAYLREAQMLLSRVGSWTCPQTLD